MQRVYIWNQIDITLWNNNLLYFLPINVKYAMPIDIPITIRMETVNKISLRVDFPLDSVFTISTLSSKFPSSLMKRLYQIVCHILPRWNCKFQFENSLEIELLSRYDISMSGSIPLYLRAQIEFKLFYIGEKIQKNTDWKWSS